MAHAAPRPGRRRTPARRPGARGMTGTTGSTVTAYRPPDVFDEQVHTVARIAWPVALGLVYGFWAAGIRRDAGPITGWNILFGFVCAIVFAVVCIALFMVTPYLRREAHAVLWASFGGVAFGFLYSQTGESVLRSVGLGLALAVAVFAFNFYRYYTHEDAEGHRVG